MEIIIGATVGLAIFFVAYMIMKDYNREEILNTKRECFDNAFIILTKRYNEGKLTYEEYVECCNKLDNLWNSMN